MPKPKKTRIKSVPKGNSRRGNNWTNSGNFINAESLRNQFFAHASCQRAGKESGDAGYWTGGRCNWGGSHNLAEDSQILADFFNGIANIDNDIKQMTLAVNEQEFNNSKRQLVNKLQECISKCQTTSATSVGGICIIWNDFFGSFLKRFLVQFQQKLQTQLNQLQNIQPVHQKEVLQIEAEIKSAETKYQENFAKANDPNVSASDKAKFIALANEALDEVKRLKRRYERNPIASLSKFNYLNDLQRLVDGNISPDPLNIPSDYSPDSDSSDNTIPRKGNNWKTWTGNSSPNSSQQNNHQLLIFIGIVALIAFYFYSQKEETETSHYDY